jgi:hypothetical protein
MNVHGGIMKRILVMALVLSVSYTHAVSMGTLGLEHSQEIKRRADGKYDVICIDGTTEVKTSEELGAGEICTHISNMVGTYLLKEGGVKDGMRFCDLDVNRLVAGTAIMNLEIGFRSPCTSAPETTDDCNGMVCNFQIEEERYTADFSEEGLLKLKRLSDEFSAVFTGSRYNPQPAPEGSIRIQTVNGINNILQATKDGATWYSVCDDGFDQQDAMVACRQLGYSRVGVMNLSIDVSDDAEFGFDDLDCAGSETSLFACPANEMAQ